MDGSRTRAPQPDPEPVDAAARSLRAAGLREGERVCVALSGGLDSVVLLDVLQQLQAHFGHVLSAAHVHHGLSPNADAWQRFCSDLCARCGIPFHALAVKIPERSAEGLEAAARRARHDALGQLRSDWLAFGHHQDDQAETLLFRLVRGSGVRGAAAMLAFERGKRGEPGRLRPMLALPRSRLERYARQRGLEWIEDESNRDPKFARNLLRHQILPQLENAFPGAGRTLGRAAALFREASDLLDELAVLDRAACGGEPLSRSALLGLSEERLRNLLRHEIARAGATAPSRERLLEAVRQLKEVGGRPLRVPLGEVACCAYRDRLWFEAAAAGAACSLPWCGEVELPWAGGLVCFDRLTGSGIAIDRLEGHEVTLTTRWQGLAMRPSAGRPTRTFKNLCQEAGIPSWLRVRLPVLQVGSEAVWIGGVGVAADWACPAGRPGVRPLWVPATGRDQASSP